MLGWAVFFLAVSVFLLNLLMIRVIRRLRVCEDRHAAIDILADQVCEIASDFYGPAA